MAKKKAKQKKSNSKKVETIEKIINDECETIVEEISDDMQNLDNMKDNLDKLKDEIETKVDKSTESKKDKFIRLFSSRVNKALKMIDNIGNCSNHTNYHFIEQQYLKGIVALQKKLDSVESKFEESLTKKEHKKDTFTL